MTQNTASPVRNSIFFNGTAFWSATAVVWTACVLGMTISPLSRMEWVMATLGDKNLHGVAFGIGVVAWALALRSPKISVWTPRLVGAAISFAIGGLVEILQKSVPGRSPDVNDFLADTIGILIALALLMATARYDKTNIKLK